MASLTDLTQLLPKMRLAQIHYERYGGQEAYRKKRDLERKVDALIKQLNAGGLQLSI